MTLNTLVPHTSAFKFVNDVEAAGRILDPHLPAGSGGASELLRAAEQLRAKIGTRMSAP